MRITISLLAVVVAGCGTNTTLPHYLSYLPEKDFGPLVSCNQLSKQDGLVYEKRSGKPFTGQTIEYIGGICHLEAYKNGGEPDYRPEPPKIEGEVFPKHIACQDAVRNYVRQYGPGHNEYSFFRQYGKRDDLPMLLYGLKSMGETTNSWIVCTQGHCLNALEKITGARPGCNYSDWAKWWKTKYKVDPPEWKPEEK